MLWGVMAYGWIGGLVGSDDGACERTIELVKSLGLDACQWGIEKLMQLEADTRAEIAARVAASGVNAVLSFHFDYFTDDEDAISRNVHETIEAIESLSGPMRAPIITTAAGTTHRFVRRPSLEEQMAQLSRILRPIAEAAFQAGCPLGIENHGDYYCSDLASLCKQTPHLGIFMDTGNTYLIGERPLPAAEAAAPYVVGTHFKDHHVRPNKKSRPLTFELRGAIPGTGDVGMAEVYGILARGAPDPDRLAMILEIDPVEGYEPMEALQKSVEFVRSL